MTPITTKHEGRTYTGQLIIEGERRLSFKVLFQGKEFTDAKVYRPDEMDKLRANAEHILWEMVTGRSQMRSTLR